MAAGGLILVREEQRYMSHQSNRKPVLFHTKSVWNDTGHFQCCFGMPDTGRILVIQAKFCPMKTRSHAQEQDAGKMPIFWGEGRCVLYQRFDTGAPRPALTFCGGDHENAEFITAQTARHGEPGPWLRGFRALCGRDTLRVRGWITTMLRIESADLLHRCICRHYQPHGPP
jgi:hypothetical protein